MFKIFSKKKNLCVLGTQGAVRESNPRPLPPEGRIIPLDQRPGPASSEDRTRDLALTKRMLCQLSYRGDRRVGARVEKAAPGTRACKKDLQKEHARRDSNPQPPDSKSGALSIAPRALAREGAGGPKRCYARAKHKNGKKYLVDN